MTPSEVLDCHVDLVARLEDIRFQEILVECFKLIVTEKINVLNR